MKCYKFVSDLIVIARIKYGNPSCSSGANTTWVQTKTNEGDLKLTASLYTQNVNRQRY